MSSPAPFRELPSPARNKENLAPLNEIETAEAPWSCDCCARCECWRAALHCYKHRRQVVNTTASFDEESKNRSLACCACREQPVQLAKP